MFYLFVRFQPHLVLGVGDAVVRHDPSTQVADMLDTVPQKAEAVGPLRALQRTPTHHSCAAGHRTLVKTDHLSGTKRLLHEQLADFSLSQSTGNETPRERNEQS